MISTAEIQAMSSSQASGEAVAAAAAGLNDMRAPPKFSLAGSLRENLRQASGSLVAPQGAQEGKSGLSSPATEPPYPAWENASQASIMTTAPVSSSQTTRGRSPMAGAVQVRLGPSNASKDKAGELNQVIRHRSGEMASSLQSTSQQAMAAQASLAEFIRTQSPEGPRITQHPPAVVLQMELKELKGILEKQYEQSQQHGATPPSTAEDEQRIAAHVQRVQKAVATAPEVQVRELCATMACQQTEQEICVRMLRANMDVLQQQVQALLRSTLDTLMRDLGSLKQELRSQDSAGLKAQHEAAGRRLRDEVDSKISQQEVEFKAWFAEFCVGAMKDTFGVQLQKHAEAIEALHHQLTNVTQVAQHGLPLTGDVLPSPQDKFPLPGQECFEPLYGDVKQASMDLARPWNNREANGIGIDGNGDARLVSWAEHVDSIRSFDMKVNDFSPPTSVRKEMEVVSECSDAHNNILLPDGNLQSLTVHEVPEESLTVHEMPEEEQQASIDQASELRGKLNKNVEAIREVSKNLEAIREAQSADKPEQTSWVKSLWQRTSYQESVTQESPTPH